MFGLPGGVTTACGSDIRPELSHSSRGRPWLIEAMPVCTTRDRNSATTAMQCLSVQRNQVRTAEDIVQRMGFCRIEPWIFIIPPAASQADNLGTGRPEFRMFT